MKVKSTLTQNTSGFKGKKHTGFQLSGKIVDSSTFIPLSNAEIYYSTDTTLKSIVSDEDGSFTIPDVRLVEGKELLIIIDYVGYSLHRIVLTKAQLTKARYTFNSQMLHCCLSINQK